MKKIYLLSVLAAMVIVIFAACGKSNNSAPTPETTVTTTGNTTNYNGYVVKTIGVSIMWVGVDENFKLTNVQVSGGGNKIVFKAGTGNTMEISNTGLATCPDNLTSKPDGTIAHKEIDIDNGRVLDTTGGAAVIKLRGFDKAKTGYNQINIVFCKYLFDGYVTGGYYSNVIFTKFKKQAGKNNADYGTNDFIYNLFKGNINVISVEIAPPKEKAYVVEDHIVTSSSVYYNFQTQKGSFLKLEGSRFRFFENVQSLNTGPQSTKGLKAEWVNANKASFTKTSNVFELKFDNMKTGGLDQVVDPSDTTNKVFLRVSGFDRDKSGFDQLRLFPADDGVYKGTVRLYSQSDQEIPRTIAQLLKAFTVTDLSYFVASPQWPHF